jgi:hypothetical protein
MACGHTYSIRKNWHSGGEAPSGSSDPLGFYTNVVSISSVTDDSVNDDSATRKKSI